MMAPFSRSLLRYGAGYLFGSQVGHQLSSDTDLVILLSFAIAAGVEGAWVLARRKGWAT